MEEDLLPPVALLGASEVFLTNTTYEIMPVRRVDATRFAVGPRSRRLHDIFRRHLDGE